MNTTWCFAAAKLFSKNIKCHISLIMLSCVYLEASRRRDILLNVAKEGGGSLTIITAQTQTSQKREAKSYQKCNF